MMRSRKVAIFAGLLFASSAQAKVPDIKEVFDNWPMSCALVFLGLQPYAATLNVPFSPASAPVAPEQFDWLRLDGMALPMPKGQYEVKWNSDASRSLRVQLKSVELAVNIALTPSPPPTVPHAEDVTAMKAIYGRTLSENERTADALAQRFDQLHCGADHSPLRVVIGLLFKQDRLRDGETRALVKGVGGISGAGRIAVQGGKLVAEYNVSTADGGRSVEVRFPADSPANSAIAVNLLAAALHPPASPPPSATRAIEALGAEFDAKWRLLQKSESPAPHK